MVLLVGIEHLLGRSQQQFVQILGSTDCSQEISQVIPFGKTSNLRSVVQADIYESFDTCPFEGLEEILRVPLRESNRIRFAERQGSSFWSESMAS